MMAAIIFLFWYNQKHSDELMKTMAYFLIATLPVAILWTVAETVAWNYDLRRKGLISKGTVYGVRQLPPE